MEQCDSHKELVSLAQKTNDAVMKLSVAQCYVQKALNEVKEKQLANSEQIGDINQIVKNGLHEKLVTLAGEVNLLTDHVRDCYSGLEGRLQALEAFEGMLKMLRDMKESYIRTSVKAIFYVFLMLVVIQMANKGAMSFLSMLWR